MFVLISCNVVAGTGVTKPFSIYLRRRQVGGGDSVREAGDPVAVRGEHGEAGQQEGLPANQR